ncbi:MAG TPA: SGNH/GDSL hydrolase family protein [Patescibacteria group bacterium]|nr:SGNH/GDSL hydrolase family protein [Patescibacteria group bacterium]
MKKIPLFVLVLQIITIAFLLGRLYLNHSKNNVLAAINVSPINKENLIFPNDPGFKFYNILTPSITSYEKGFWASISAEYNFNKDGLNDQLDYSTTKPDGVFRIITLGDSFTFGEFVDTKDNWPERLENLLNKQIACPNIKKFEVINLGMRGFDIPYIVKRFTDLGLKYSPDLVVWLENGSGFRREMELLQPIIQDCRVKFPQETNSSESVNKFDKCWDDGYRNMLEVYTEERVENDLEETSSKFFNLRGLTPTLFATFKDLNPNDKKTLENRIKGQTKVYFTDSLTDLNSQTTFPDGHPNIPGHTIIAQDVFKYLLNNKNTLLGCNQSLETK